MIRSPFALPLHGARRSAARAMGLLLLAGCAAFLAAPVWAQAPKAFEYYNDEQDLGFKIKVPKDWQFIPPQPGDKNLIGKYDPKGDKGIDLKNGYYFAYHVWLVKFDRRKKPSDGAPKPDERRFESPGYKDVQAFIKGNEIEVSGNWKRNEKESGPISIQGITANSSIYELTKDGVELRLYVAEYKLSDNLEVALIANGPGDHKKWQKFEGAFNTMGRSLKPIELKAISAADARPGDSPLRSRKRAELDALMRQQPGWALYETPNYFIISNNTDKEFLDEMMIRLEAIRSSYEETYPPETVLELKRLRDEARAKRKAEEAASGTPKSPEDGEEDEEEEPEEDGVPGRTSARGATALEQSRCSVVRVVQNESQYTSYGGPPGSAGYWSSGQQELVIYDDKAQGGRRNTWATMNHEAFHQYIYYFFGNLAPHSWYNEGTGDFYAGYQLKNSRFELKPFDWRIQTIKEALRQRSSGKQTFIPLKELVRYTQGEYYGGNKHGLSGGQNYAQGWSFIWFLRTGSKNARGWNKAWTPILDEYLKTLVLTDDLDKAVDQAFSGVDFDELEAAWIEYTLAI